MERCEKGLVHQLPGAVTVSESDTGEGSQKDSCKMMGLAGGEVGLAQLGAKVVLVLYKRTNSTTALDVRLL